MQIAARLLREDDGQSLIEYALLAGIIAIAAISVLELIRGNLLNVFTAVNEALSGADVGDVG